MISSTGTRVTMDSPEVEKMFRTYLPAYEASGRPFPDVQPALHRFRQTGSGVAILSNGDRTQQEAKLDALGLTPRPALFVPADLGAAKPAPAAFRNACRAMGWAPTSWVHAPLTITRAHNIDVGRWATRRLFRDRRSLRDACWVRRV